MPFDTFTPRLKIVADAGLQFCKSRFGRNGLKVEVQIDSNISWQPSFHMKPAASNIIACEVSEILYPEILKIASHDIVRFDFPISVFLICPLEVYLGDKTQATVNKLKRDGFGIIAVDDLGAATQQHTCVPLAQHISEDELDQVMRGLTTKLKFHFRSAHTTYLVNQGQGLQEAGQIVEALVVSLAQQAVRKWSLSNSILNKSAAYMIDDLYNIQQLNAHRAALGGARNFVNNYRNTASHPARSAKMAVNKIRNCRIAFLQSIDHANGLRKAITDSGFRTMIHLT